MRTAYADDHHDDRVVVVHKAAEHVTDAVASGPEQVVAYVQGVQGVPIEVMTTALAWMIFAFIGFMAAAVLVALVALLIWGCTAVRRETRSHERKDRIAPTLPAGWAKDGP